MKLENVKNTNSGALFLGELQPEILHKNDNLPQVLLSFAIRLIVSNREIIKHVL